MAKESSPLQHLARTSSFDIPACNPIFDLGGQSMFIYVK
jgi:hypothetical protein